METGTVKWFNQT